MIMLSTPKPKITVNASSIIQVGPVEWEISVSYRGDMRVPARFFTNPKRIYDVFQDKALEQLINVTTLPGIVKFALAMPDMHQGYGFPIGGVAAVLIPEGAISPGGIGYDINCGVRLLLSDIAYDDFNCCKVELANELSRAIPSGTGRVGKIMLNRQEIDKVLTLGINWALEQGLASLPDLGHIESGGRLIQANSETVSDFAKKRGSQQLGTLGAGNHFIEVGMVERIFDQATAKIFGLSPGQVTVLIHTGSRGLGHQVATDYIQSMLDAMPKFGIEIPDKELACLPFSSKLGQAYYSAMSAAANYAWVNRQVLSFITRQTWQKFFGYNAQLKLMYDVAHNIAKIEEHEIERSHQKVLVQRKGATRAFGPNHPDICKDYQISGQPVIIPGSMGSFSFVLAGTKLAMKKSFGSTCHGAGRQMSRHKAKYLESGRQLQEELLSQGIIIKTASLRDLPEEAPYAYKDIDEVINTVHKSGIARKVARLRPLIVIKG